MSQLIAMFCDIDDFCKGFEPLYTQRLLQSGQRQRPHQTELTLSEMLTIIVFFQIPSNFVVNFQRADNAGVIFR